MVIKPEFTLKMSHLSHLTGAEHKAKRLQTGMLSQELLCHESP